MGDDDGRAGTLRHQNERGCSFQDLECDAFQFLMRSCVVRMGEREDKGPLEDG